MPTELNAVHDLRPVAASIRELVAAATEREPFAPEDGKSGVGMERVVIDGERYVLKYLHVADDWIMRATGDIGCRPITLWRTGWLDRMPASIDHTIVGAAWDDRADGRGGAILMRDVSEHLLPEGDHPIPMEQHLGFIDHMAELHAAFWGWADTVELMPLSTRFVIFGPALVEAERSRGGTNPVPTRFVPEGWAQFAVKAPRTAAFVLPLREHPDPLLTALRSLPQTFVHGDWKAGNLGTQPDGRTILLDWAIPGASPACAEIAWYICLNRARLPQTKEESLLAYREALERHGIVTEAWWERQLALCLLGTLMLFGWEKALGEGDEHAEDLAWWEAKALEGAGFLE